jgi:hypothetical protein
MASEEARPQLERLGLSDVLTTLCPGAVLLTSTAIWLPLNDGETVNRMIEGASSAAGSFLLLLVSYAFGLVLNAWADQGFVRFVRLSTVIHSRRGLKRVLTILWFAFVAFFHGRKYRSVANADLNIRFEMYEIVRERYGESVVRLLTKSNLFYVFRVLVWCLVRDKEEIALKEGDAIFRRRGFAQGVALAGMCAGVQAAAFLVLVVLGRVPHNVFMTSIMIGVMAISFGGSVILRTVAWRLYCDEQIFSYAVLRSAMQLSEAYKGTGKASENVGTSVTPFTGEDC